MRSRKVGASAILWVLLAAPVVGGDVWTLQREPESVQSLLKTMRLVDLAPPSVPTDTNGIGWLWQAVDGLTWPETEEASAKDALTPGRSATGWSEAEWRAVRALVAINAPAREAASRAFEAPALSFELEYALGFDMEIPNFVGLLELARLLRAEGEVALTSADLEGMLAAVEELGAMAECLYRESTLITALVGMAVERQQLRMVASALGSELPATALRGLSKRLPETHLPTVVQRALVAEAMLFRDADVEQRLGTTDAIGLRRLLLAPFDHVIRNDGLEYLTQVIAAAAEPWSSWRERRREGELEPGFWADLSPLPPRADEVVERAAGVAASRELARTALTLAGARGAGGYPDRLANAPSSPYTGRPLRLVREASGQVTLADPGGDVLWEASNPGVSGDRRPILRWTLP